MTSGGEARDVYRLVFELTARATDVPYETFLQEMVEGLAAHYHASICRLHVGQAQFAVATADNDDRLGALNRDERVRFDTVDALLAEGVKSDGVLRTALDLDGGQEIVNYLARALQTPETFAFPLVARNKAFGAITFYLPDAYPFAEEDVRGLQAIGNVLHAANHQATGAEPSDSIPVTSKKLLAYQETLERVGKILDELLFLTDARTILMLDGHGDFIAKRGEDTGFSTTSFASVVASGFAASRRLAGIYGAHNARSISYEGDRDSVFLIEVADRALLCVVYSDHNAPALVTRWAKSAAKRLVKHYKALTEARVL
ncbi:MAG: roadblock/LC7 domain-containing protein [Planctomycetota bacterium]|nr:roadblock/LC7 domain-containing protein [Planctomycetota bacterium]